MKLSTTHIMQLFHAGVYQLVYTLRLSSLRRTWNQQAERIMATPIARENYVLFDFQIERVLLVMYDEEKKMVVRRWSREKVLE